MFKPIIPIIDWSNPISKGLVLDVEFFERGGQNIQDLVSKVKTTVSGTLSRGSDINGAVRVFSRTQYINIPDSTLLDFTAGCTVHALIKLSNTDPNNTIISKRSAYDATGIPFELNCDGQTISWRVIGSSANQTTGNINSIGIWYHIVGTWDGATQKLYRDGIELLSQSRSGTITANNATATIGGLPSAGGEQFGGSMSFVRVWNRGLSPSEIKQLYKNPWAHYVNPKPILGASVDTITTQTITGVSRIAKTVAQTVTGKSRITKTATQTVTGLARIQKSVSQTISGVARITAQTLRTITGVARIEKTATATIQGLARVTTSASQTITGLSRITVSTLRTITGVSRIEKYVSQTIQGLARISTTVSQTITGVANITVSAINQTINGVARVQVTVAQTIAGVSRIALTTLRTITGLSRITTLSNQTISGIADILKSVDRTIDGKSLIEKTLQATISGVSLVQTIVYSYITGKANIVGLTSQTITGKSNIAKPIAKGRTILIPGRQTLSVKITNKSVILKQRT